MYSRFFKRVLDLFLALSGFLLLFPIIALLAVIGAVAMRGNPFFTQMRPGKIDKKSGEERIFRLIKFRTMDNRRDEQGNLLPDEVRLNAYGRFLRATSLDELPELINIIKGDMAIVGPRPLLVRYLPRYSQTQRRRHEVRPGLTGYAQVCGRNAISWEQKFALDVEYVDNITFAGDMKIVFLTVKAVLKREGISSSSSATMEEFFGNDN